MKKVNESGIPHTLLELVYEAAIDDTQWENALHAIAGWVDAAGAMYCLLDRFAEKPRITALYTAGYSSAANADYAGRGCLIDPHMQVGRQTPCGEWFLSHEHFDHLFISRNAFFQEIMNPLGVRWVGGSRVWESDASVSCLALQKPLDASPFRETDRARLAAITAHLQKATRIHERLMRSAFDAAAGLEATSRLAFGVALLDAQARVLYANPAAERFFARTVVFRSAAGGGLALRHAACHARFSRAIAATMRLNSHAMCIVDRTGKPILHSIISPVPASARWSAAWERPVAMLVMTEIDSGDAVPSRVLQQLFALTPTEAVLAQWLTTGRSLNDYAAERGVSVETVRTQLRAVLSKTGTRRQAELVAFLAKLSAFAEGDARSGFHPFG